MKQTILIRSLIVVPILKILIFFVGISDKAFKKGKLSNRMPKNKKKLLTADHKVIFENFDNYFFTGPVYMGTSASKHEMIYDTGSSVTIKLI